MWKTQGCPLNSHKSQEQTWPVRHICAGNVKEYRRRLFGYLTRSVSEGAKSGDFARVPAEENAILILSVINGIVRYKDINKNMREAAVDFCRRSLMNGVSSG